MQSLGLGLLLSLLTITSVFAESQNKPSYDSERCRKAAKLAKQPVPLPYNPTDSTTDVFLRIKGVRYAIPANYFRYPPVGCDTEETGFLLRVLLPEFEGYTKQNSGLMEGGGNKRKHMNILLRGKVNPDMKSTFQAYARDVDPKGRYPTWQGLYQAKNWYGDDVYFERDGGRITFIMNCKPERPNRYPSCKQHFPYRGAVIQQTFSRTLKEDWKEIRAGAVKMLDRFVRNANEGN